MTAAEQAFGTTKSFLGLQMGFFGLDAGHIVMILVGLGFIYLAIKKEWEPYELLPIGAGMAIGLAIGASQDAQFRGEDT